MIIIISLTINVKNVCLFPLVPVTFVPGCIASAVDTGSSPLVALVTMSVTFTWPAVREAPVSSLTTITALTKRTAWHGHCPEYWSQNRLWEPSKLHSQTKERQKQLRMKTEREEDKERKQLWQKERKKERKKKRERKKERKKEKRKKKKEKRKKERTKRRMEKQETKKKQTEIQQKMRKE